MADATQGSTATAGRPSASGKGLISNKGKGEEKMQVKDIKNPADLIRWFLKDPLSRWPILLFLGVFCLSIIFIIIAAIDAESIYVTAGIASIVIAIYGANHFKTLMALKEVIFIYILYFIFSFISLFLHLFACLLLLVEKL